MKRVNFKAIYVTVSCLIITLLCGCNLFVTDKDKFYMDKNLDYSLSRIDIEKAGKDISIPAKIGDTKVWRIYLADPYYSKIDSLDVSKVKDLESFYLKLFGGGSASKLKELDFSKNKKLKSILVSETNTLNRITFNNNCEDIYLESTSVKKINTKLLKNLRDFSYYNGPLEELDISNNPNLEYIRIGNTHLKGLDFSNNPNLEYIRIRDSNIKSLDVSKNPKLKHIIVDEGTQIIGPTNAQIEYNKRTE